MNKYEQGFGSKWSRRRKLQDMVTEPAVRVRPSCIHTGVRWSLCIALRLNLASGAYRCSRRFQHQKDIQPNGVLFSASDGHERQSAVETPDAMAPRSDKSTEHGSASRASAIEVPSSYWRIVSETPASSTYVRGHMSAENVMRCHERASRSRTSPYRSGKIAQRLRVLIKTSVALLHSARPAPLPEEPAPGLG